MNKKNVITGIAFALLVALAITGCSGGAEATLKAQEYTDEIARAIIESGWKISGSIVLAGVLCGLFSGN